MDTVAKKMIEEFFENLERMGSRLTSEDLEIAGESMRVFAEFERIRQEKQRKMEVREQEQVQETEEALSDDGITEIALSLDWEDDTPVPCGRMRTDSVSDALIYSLNDRGCVDLSYVAELCDRSCDEVIRELGSAIYQDPEHWGECPYEGWVTADEYLSGNLLVKWRVANQANKRYKGRFAANLEALAAILPESIATEDIYVTIGSPWIPPDVIDSFIEHMIGEPAPSGYRHCYKTVHDEVTGIWEIPGKNRYCFGRFAVKDSSIYGTKRMGMLTILEYTLNVKTVAVYDKVPCKTNKSGEATVLNETETVLALEKQEKMVKEFQRWVWKDEDRRERLCGIYDDLYGSICRRRFDGSFLRIPGLSPDVELYPYQKDAIARILFTPNTLLAHDVGAGKTYIMIVAGMELRRIGISKKNLYVVPNNLVGQWRDAFLRLYPKANLLCVEPAQFGKSKRAEVLGRIRDGDFDGIIMAYSCFDRIPLSEAYYDQAYSEILEILRGSKGVFHSPATVEKKIRSVLSALEKVKKRVADASLGIPFDDLGINTLFVDEAHNYKNVPIETKITKVLGIGRSGSEKCREMMDKVHCVQRNNNGRGVIMATGTPITNSITDIFVMQKYLQSGELSLMGLQHFDAWVGMFAERRTEFEIDVDTGGYRMAIRFSKFHNLPELTAILSSVADFHTVEESGLPAFEGYTDCLLGKTVELEDYLKEISYRADAVRARKVPRTEDNMLCITTDGRKAALDIRLVKEEACFHPNSKVARCVENVFSLYIATKEERSTQLIFCDSSTPKEGFNIYDETARLLEQMGIPSCEIAYVHDATTEKKRNELFESVRQGRVRVLIGSTFKLGLGVNVQERLVAIHHLDVPWRPADMTQREGRILRRGNTSRQVVIYRYVTEGSFDAYSWQLLESKQRFITDLLSGSLKDRSGSDVDSTVLSYAEIKAIAVGDPLMKRRVETANELGRYCILQREATEARERMERELAEIPNKMHRQRALMATCVDDIVCYTEHKREYGKREAKAIRERIDIALRVNADKPVETEVLTYQGFRVVIPPNTPLEKPCVRLERAGKYYVEMGESEQGVTRRLDFFLDNFGRQYEAFNKGLMQLMERRRALCEALERDVGYSAEIERCRRELEKLDKALGVA